MELSRINRKNHNLFNRYITISGCCCMIHSSPNTIKKELANDLNKDTTYEEIDLEQLEEDFAKKNNKKNDKKLEKNGIIKPPKRPKTPKISVNQQQQNANQETSVSGEDQTTTPSELKRRKIVIFNTEILTSKVVLWCFFMSETSEKIHNSTFRVKISV